MIPSIPPATLEIFTTFGDLRRLEPAPTALAGTSPKSEIGS
jgi:hypothetical protein